MLDTYDQFVATGAIGSLKRDILVEASCGIHYLAHIRKWFAERVGADAAEAVATCTARVVSELIAGDLCRLATWGKDRGSPVVVDMTEEAVAGIVDKYQSLDPVPLDYFLLSTDAGNRWASRYLALIAEL